MARPLEIRMSDVEATRSERANLWARHPISVYLATALVMIVILSLSFILRGKAFAFADIGVDTFFQFFPLQIADCRQLHALHTITWSFNLGLGGYLGSLFDPLLLLTGWLPESWQLASRLPMFAFRVIAAGGFFYGYLRLLHFESRIAILGGLCYAFSSYGMLNSQWEVLSGTEFVQFAIFLFLFEKYLDTRSRWVPVGAGIVIGLGNPMGLYMFGLFGLIYALARLTAIASGGRLTYVRKVLSFAAWCIPGLLIVAPLLFPALHYLLESPRVSGNHSALHAILLHLLQFNDHATISSEIAGLFGKDLLGSDMNYAGWGNYLEGPGFYVGILPLLCIPQLLGPAASRNERRLCVIGLIGIALYFVFPAFRFAVYGFGHIAFRFSTVWISALLLVLGLAGLRRILATGAWRPGLMLATLLVLGLPLVGVLLAPDKINYEQLLRVAGFGCVYTAILWRITKGNPLCNQVISLLVPIVACELLLFATPAVVQRKMVNLDASSPIGLYHDGTENALDHVRRIAGGTDFFRIDKTYRSAFLDDALVQNYPGTASYFFHAASISRFVDSMNLDRSTPGPNYISSMSNRRDVMDLLDVRYLLARDRKPDAERDLTYLTTVGDVNIYRNATAHAFGTFYSSLASEASADALPVPQRDAFLLANAVVDNPAAVNAKLARLRPGAGTAASIRKADIALVRDDALSGTIQTPSASLLLLAMPYDRGWNASIDGTPVDLFRADYGLTALLAPAGKHAISLAYEPSGRRIGIALSLSSIALLLLLWRNDHVKPASLRHMLSDKAPNLSMPSSAVRLTNCALEYLSNRRRQVIGIVKPRCHVAHERERTDSPSGLNRAPFAQHGRNAAQGVAIQTQDRFTFSTETMPQEDGSMHQDNQRAAKHQHRPRHGLDQQPDRIADAVVQHKVVKSAATADLPLVMSYDNVAVRRFEA